jgi:hypothetical protein
VKNRFQDLPFKCNLQRYITAAAVDLFEALAKAESRPNRRALRSSPLRLLRERFATEVGLCTLNQVDP